MFERVVDGAAEKARLRLPAPARKAIVSALFEREVKPHVSDAWIDTGKRDPRDGQVGLVRYEINLDRYFYRYTPPRPWRRSRPTSAASSGTSCGCWQVTGEGAA